MAGRPVGVKNSGPRNQKLTAKQEEFCLSIVSGVSQTQSYIDVYGASWGDRQ